MQKKILDLMCDIALAHKQVESRSEFRRLYEQGALKLHIGGEWVDLRKLEYEPNDNTKF